MLWLLPSVARAENALIRDAEIEAYLHALMQPLAEAAGLDQEAVHLMIIQNDTINAFVAGGTNIFLNTGLLTETKNPEMLLGVLAHETGHIASGHLLRGAETMKEAQMGAIISYVLGAAAAAAGAGDAGMAVITGGPEVAMRSMLAYTRANERAADALAMQYLDDAQITSRGMLEMFERLQRNEKRYLGKPDPFTRSHPLSFERIQAIRNHLAHSPAKSNRLPQELQVGHRRMLAKLKGFLYAPDRILNEYPKTDTSLEAKYARAVAYYRASSLSDALQEIDSLLAEAPNDPYFYELKGQALFENGKIAEARAAYRKALDLAPAASIIRADYARTLLALKDKALLPEAISELSRATSEDSTYGGAWQALADAYGKSGNEPMANLALAESANLRGDFDGTIRFARMARKGLKQNSPAYQRALDLADVAKQAKKDKD